VPLLHYCMPESLREPSRGAMQQVGGYLPRTRKGDLTNGDYSEETDLGEALSCEQFTEIWQKINRGNKVRYVKLTFNGKPDEDTQSGLQREVTRGIKMEGGLHSIFHPEYDTSSFLKIRGNNTFVLNSFRGARGKKYEESLFVRIAGIPMTLAMDAVIFPYVSVLILIAMVTDGGPR
jgi:hypothetical protein